jgi:YbgC/YbaW family acyl-CoA thioester hydrolase
MSGATYTTTRKVMMRDADPAGVLYFARYLTFAHEAYEEFMESRGLSLLRCVRDGAFIIPVIHAESTHRLPLWLGETAAIQLTVAEIRSRAFTITYVMRTADGRLAATCRTVHAAVDKATRRAIPLPPELRAALSP